MKPFAPSYQEPAPRQQPPVQRDEQKMPSTISAGSYSGNVELIEMDRMRRLIADHMVRSKHTSPHVTSFTEADVTNMVLWRNRIKKDFEKREGTKITFMPLFIEAIIRCIKNKKTITGLSAGHTTWISPERAGGAVSFS